MGKKITQKTLFWLDYRGKVSLEQPPLSVQAVPFRLEELEEGKEVFVVTERRSYLCDAGWVLFADEVGRIVVSFSDELHWVPPRARKIRVIASNPECLAQQFGGTYDAKFYIFR